MDKISWVNDLDSRTSYIQDIKAEEIANEIKKQVKEEGINAFIEIFSKWVVLNDIDNIIIKRR